MLTGILARTVTNFPVTVLAWIALHEAELLREHAEQHGAQWAETLLLGTLDVRLVGCVEHALGHGVDPYGLCASVSIV